jgi:hypothetical protein
MSACCPPSSDRPDDVVRATPLAQSLVAGEDVVELDLVALPGGVFWMGAPGGDWYAADGEGLVHEVRLAPFEIASTTITNAQFAAFCDATGHVTLAEADGWSFVFGGLLPDGFPPRAVWPSPRGGDRSTGPTGAIRLARTPRTAMCSTIQAMLAAGFEIVTRIRAQTGWWLAGSGAAEGAVRLGPVGGGGSGEPVEGWSLIERSGDRVEEIVERLHVAPARRREDLLDHVVAWDVHGVDPVHRIGDLDPILAQSCRPPLVPGVERLGIGEQ